MKCCVLLAAGGGQRQGRSRPWIRQPCPVHVRPRLPILFLASMVRTWLASDACAGRSHGVRDLPAGQDVAALRKLRCSECGSFLRPDVVLFGESLPADEWRAAVQACRSLSSRDCMLVVGTSGGVYPAAGLPEAVLQAGVPVIEVNKDPSPISRDARCFLKGSAAEVLPRLVAAALASAQ